MINKRFVIIKINLLFIILFYQDIYSPSHVDIEFTQTDSNLFFGAGETQMALKRGKSHKHMFLIYHELNLDVVG